MKLTEEEILDLIDLWHTSNPEPVFGRPFQEDWALAGWLEWTKEQYIHWVQTNEAPNQEEESYYRVKSKLNAR